MSHKAKQAAAQGSSATGRAGLSPFFFGDKRVDESLTKVANDGVKTASELVRAVMGENIKSMLFQLPAQQE